MCHQCNYRQLLASKELDTTRNRLDVLEIVGNNQFPLAADDIYKTLERHSTINRVTVYRVLDLLVSKGIVERLSAGGRAAYYGIAPNEHHQPYPHFYRKRCGQMDCLNPDSLEVDTGRLWNNFPGRIDRFEVRVDGLRKNCLKQLPAGQPLAGK